MPRNVLDKKISHLLEQILELEGMVASATIRAIEALNTQDLVEAINVYKGDEIINARRFDLENHCMITIATQQPIVARDLRMLASILEVVGELERMGDYAKGIAKICLRIGNDPRIKPSIALPEMTDIVLEMLKNSVEAFVKADSETARRIPEQDDQVDELYHQVYLELVDVMRKDQTSIDQANLLLWVAHNLERMADRVTNICERTIYIATGELTEIDVSDDESRWENPNENDAKLIE